MSQFSGGGSPPSSASRPYVDDPTQAQTPGRQNPYAAPGHHGLSPTPGRAGPLGEWVACPRCSSTHVSRPTFTWWGGVLGPRIIPEVKCDACGHRYNGKTGGSNATAIAIYMAVAFVVVFGFLIAALVVLL